jgi:serine/threonine protein kinase
VCLYRLLTAKYPFYLKTKTLSETKQMLKDQENKNWSYIKYLKIDPKVDDLLNRLLEPNEDNRIDWYAIRSHKWLEGETSLTHTD